MNVRQLGPLLAVLLVLIVAGCGNRGIPAIRPELLEGKISVLMITSDQTTESVEQTVEAALREWRTKEGIAYEWHKDVAAWDENFIHKLESRTYDYIYVIGSSLLTGASQAAEQQLGSAKWTLLQDEPGFSTEPGAGKAAWLQVDSSQAEALKKSWAEEKLAANTQMEWVTTASRPIPAEWAPSEEADHIVLLDNNPDWMKQLAFQTVQHYSSWVVFYAPVDEASMSQARNLGVSVMDWNGALSAELNWPVILQNRLTVMKERSWKQGMTSFTQQELKELKLK